MKKWGAIWVFVSWSLALAHALVPHHHHAPGAEASCDQTQHPVADFFGDIDLGDNHLDHFAPEFASGVMAKCPSVYRSWTPSPIANNFSYSALWIPLRSETPALRGPPAAV